MSRIRGQVIRVFENETRHIGAVLDPETGEITQTGNGPGKMLESSFQSYGVDWDESDMCQLCNTHILDSDGKCRNPECANRPT